MSLNQLVITEEKHPKLYRFARYHPEVLEVFHNIELDRPLRSGVILSSGDSEEIVNLYIEHLHVPLLVESGAVAVNSDRACGYEPLVSGLVYKEYDSVYSAQVVADRASAISRVARSTDNKENSLYCYYHGSGESVRASSALLGKIRALVLEHVANPGKAEEGYDGNAFDLTISARISDHEKK